MKCPFCGKDDLKVVDKRDISDLLIRRRRECNVCNKRFTTYERITESEILILKKTGSREKFDKNKLKQGIFLAVKKRPVTLEQVDNIVETVEHLLRSSGNIEFESAYIGSLVLEQLKKIDDVAYLKFASYFKSFKNLEDFKNEIKTLEGAK